MLWDSPSKLQIQKQAWIRAANFCGGAKHLGKKIGETRDCISKWINRDKPNISFDAAVRASLVTGISLDCLSPNTLDINKHFKPDQLTIQCELKRIVVKNLLYFGSDEPNRPIIIGTNLRLISGGRQLTEYQKKGIKNIPVVVLDLEAFLLKMQTIQDIDTDFLIDERVAIGLSLKRLAGNHQGERTDRISKLGEKYFKNNGQLVFPGTQVNKNIDGKIAEIVGLSSRSTYLRAKQVCLNGLPELINAMNSKQIDIKNAAKISEAPKEQQYELLNTWKLNNKRRRVV